MAQKIQIIIEYYDQEERIIEGTKIEAGSAKRFREKGLNVEEFKKLIRKKFGDGVDIVNKVKKHRDEHFGEKHIPGAEGKSKDDRFNTKDIIEIMKNKYSD
jgi:hypothetical protein